MSFRHVALFRWQPELPAGHEEVVRTALLGLAATLEGCRSYACGPDAGVNPIAYDFGVVAEFEDKAGWDAYMADAEHDRIREELIGPFVTDRATFQLALDH
jgi:hypothetical protein